MEKIRTRMYEKSWHLYFLCENLCLKKCSFLCGCSEVTTIHNNKIDIALSLQENSTLPKFLFLFERYYPKFSTSWCWHLFCFAFAQKSPIRITQCDSHKTCLNHTARVHKKKVRNVSRNMIRKIQRMWLKNCTIMLFLV